MRGMEAKGVPNWAVGVILVVLIAIGSVLAYTKELPWTDRYEVSAVFGSAQSLRPSSPVRIAGVNVGEVTDIEHVGQVAEAEDPQAVRVTIALNESARPLAADATFKVRPRLFLEGNYFIDVTPGSPSAPEVDDGHSFGLEQTSYSVQLDQVLTTLQGDVRANLQMLLDQFGNAMSRYGGGDGFREMHRSSAPAYRYTSQVNEAFLGTEPGDLAGVIDGLDRVLRGLGRNEQALRDLVTNFRVVSGSFAARDEALGRAIERLPGFLAEGEPAFAELSNALPGLRAFAREALPGVRSTPETLRIARPFLAQLSELMSRSELRGLVAQLRPTVPELVKLARGNISFLKQSRALSSCFNETIIPWSNSTVEPVDPLGLYPHEPGGRTFEETMYGITGISSESRSGDANGQYIRVLGASGPNLVRFPNLDGVRDAAFGLTPYPLLGAMPRISDSVKTNYRPNVPCETQEPPNLEAGVGSPPAQETLPASVMGGLESLTGPGADGLRSLASKMSALEDVEELRSDGRDRRADEVIGRAQRALDRLGLTELDLTSTLGGKR